MNLSNIQPHLDNHMLFTIVICIIAITICFSICIFYLSFRTKKFAKLVDSSLPSHKVDSNKSQWRKSIDSIVDDYNNNLISHDEACAKLASIARKYVSLLTGKDITTFTLKELSSLRNKWNNKIGADKLRQTITALYPCEFADRNINNQAQQTSVEQAAHWVLILLESWSSNDRNSKRKSRRNSKSKSKNKK